MTQFLQFEVADQWVKLTENTRWLQRYSLSFPLKKCTKSNYVFKYLFLLIQCLVPYMEFKKWFERKQVEQMKLYESYLLETESK